MSLQNQFLNLLILIIDMCTSPLHLVRPALGFNLDVPCNDCLECRNASQDSWVFRLGSDLKDLYSNKGFAVFLTFTYNNACLPHTSFGFNADVVPCFNANHVSSFLNKIKVFMSRNYGKNSYRYFWCSEYGHDTKRPHYHALFMLPSYVDFTEFVEKCRQYWNFGFMFPRNVNGYYIDSNGKKTTPLLHHVENACAYVCKYITKDLDYCNLPIVKKYYEERKFLPSDVRSFFNRYLPKHWQSKSIGSSYFHKVSTPSSLMHAIEFGVSNPTNMRLIQLPRYYVEHFCFTHLRNVVCGRPHVVRELRDEYRHVVRKVHEMSYRSKIQSLNDFILNINFNQLKKIGYNLSDLKLIRSFSRNTEYLFCKHFVNNLSPKARFYFNYKKYSLCLHDVLNARMDLYDLVLDDFDEDFDIDDTVEKVFDIFNNIVLPQRDSINQVNYAKFLKLKKLRLINQGLL